MISFRAGAGLLGAFAWRFSALEKTGGGIKLPCYSPCHVPPYCHPAARAQSTSQSSFSLREAAFWDVQKENPPPRARCPGALGL